MELAQFNITSSLFVGAALILRLESFFRMLIVDTTNGTIKKFWPFFLFCIMNISALIVESAVPIMIVASKYCSDPDIYGLSCLNWFYIARPNCRSSCSNEYYVTSCYIADDIRMVFNLIAKVALLHLAYLQCKNVCSIFTSPVCSLYNSPKFIYFHITIMGIRLIELILLVAVNILDTTKCVGAYCNPDHPECLFIPVVLNI
ncbi:hypothetical protein F8M41_009303 [Gigaspora margarita]|uniref:Uncharacterized protein n=1 Tax=Gigaspora margarita TaxID=4874 RepID=A0A8H4EVB2_GIGMA|nr:hypothetical protein F8M41_009303 [Gigaspora margarita]